MTRYGGPDLKRLLPTYLKAINPAELLAFDMHTRGSSKGLIVSSQSIKIKINLNTYARVLIFNLYA
jgi:hypothetical protein